MVAVVVASSVRMMMMMMFGWKISHCRWIVVAVRLPARKRTVSNVLLLHGTCFTEHTVSPQTITILGLVWATRWYMLCARILAFLLLYPVYDHSHVDRIHSAGFAFFVLFRLTKCCIRISECRKDFLHWSHTAHALARSR